MIATLLFHLYDVIVRLLSAKMVEGNHIGALITKQDVLATFIANTIRSTRFGFADATGGGGWGPIALSLAFASPEATVWAADVNERALELTELNAKRNGCGNVRVIRTDADAKPVDPTALSPDLTFDAIWSNPPIRIGKEALHTMLMNWLPRLSPDGVTYLVVQKNLGADSLINWLADALGDGYAVSKYHSAKGFRVIEVARA